MDSRSSSFFCLISSCEAAWTLRHSSCCSFARTWQSSTVSLANAIRSLFRSTHSWSVTTLYSAQTFVHVFLFLLRLRPYFSHRSSSELQTFEEEFSKVGSLKGHSFHVQLAATFSTCISPRSPAIKFRVSCSSEGKDWHLVRRKSCSWDAKCFTSFCFSKSWRFPGIMTWYSMV